MLIPNLRIGGLGMGGSISSTGVDAFGVRRDAQLKVSLSGFTVEYVVPLDERLNIAAGALLGWGSVGLVLRRDIGGINLWGAEQQIFENGSPVTNSMRTLSGSYFAWVPSVSVEYSILGWLAVRAGVSYVGMSAPSWTVDDNYELLGVPDDVNGKGVMVNAGLLLGTF
jgi:hypothetical protein